MKATVKFFAALREMIGTRELSLEVIDGQTVGDLFRELCVRFPRLADYGSILLYSVNAEYVPPDHTLRDGDEVAFIPPVSGGCGAD
jgi:molybdopterin converting factor subunit 1